MNKHIFFALLAITTVVYCCPAVGQAIANDTGGAIYLNRNEAEIDNSLKRGYYVGPHILGDTITMLLNKFENDYTYYKSSEGAYSTEEKIVLKPAIYKAIKKVNKFYSKEVAKNRLPAASSYESLKRVLRVGIQLMNYVTPVVESDLKKLKDPKEIEEYILALKFR